jgi:hypothetical protein
VTDLTMPRTTVEVTDVVGQLARRSRRIYANDASRFASWLDEHDLTIPVLTYSWMVQYRQFLEDTYRPATAQRMSSVARRILEDYVRKGVRSAIPARAFAAFLLRTRARIPRSSSPKPGRSWQLLIAARNVGCGTMLS